MSTSLRATEDLKTFTQTAATWVQVIDLYSEIQSTDACLL